MAFDEDLAATVRSALRSEGAVREVKMFGGIGFMLSGNLVAAASKRGLLMRVGKDQQQKALGWPATRPMEMRGRTMEGYVYIDPPGITKDSVKSSLKLALAFVRTLPPKMPGQRPVKKRKV